MKPVFTLLKKCEFCGKNILYDGCKNHYKRRRFCSRSCFNKGTKGNRTGNRRGAKHSLEAKQKVKEAVKKLWSSPEYRKHMSDVHKGKTGEKASHWKGGLSGHISKTEAICQKCGKKFFRTHKKTRFCSRECSRDSISKTLKEKYYKGELKGSDSNFWRGGKSFEPYTTDWTETLRRSIRERDHYICQLCGLQQGDIAFDVHHIDYDKKNCNPNNLISLCAKCHRKTNGNRSYWINYFS